MSLRRITLLCGVFAPPLWAASIAICGALRPGFSHVAQYISELGERGSSTELFMRYGGFVPTGLMHVAFAAFLFATFRGRLAAGGAVLLGVNGLARIGAGFFSCEPGCAEAASLAAQLHGLFASVGFAALLASVLLWGLEFLRSDLRGLAVHSAACGAIGVAFLALMVWNPEPGGWRGAYERVASGVLSLWIFVFALRAWKGAALR